MSAKLLALRKAGLLAKLSLMFYPFLNGKRETKIPEWALLITVKVRIQIFHWLLRLLSTICMMGKLKKTAYKIPLIFILETAKKMVNLSKPVILKIWH